MVGTNVRPLAPHEGSHQEVRGLHTKDAGTFPIAADVDVEDENREEIRSSASLRRASQDASMSGMVLSTIRRDLGARRRR